MLATLCCGSPHFERVLQPFILFCSQEVVPVVEALILRGYYNGSNGKVSERRAEIVAREPDAI